MTIKRSLLFISFILMLAAGYIYLTYGPQLPVANGYAAKKMCSCIFIADRDMASVQSEDLDISPINLTKTTIDYEARSATSTLFGLSPKTAIFKEQLGCVLIEDEAQNTLDFSYPPPILSDTTHWPHGSHVTLPSSSGDVDLSALNEAIMSVFDPTLAMDSLKTRSVVVVHKDKIIAEQYATGFDKDTEILGWSMSKSLTSVLIGIIVKNGQLSLNDTGLFDQWIDDRKDISIKDLLQMQSGLDFSEVYDQISDVTNMLYKSDDIRIIPRSDPLAYSPGDHWSYSSGTSNLLTAIIREKIGSDQEYWQYPYDSLFYRIGMTQTIMETDEAGNFIGSSYTYAPPRDWARFGLLMLRNGDWYGDQVVDSSWVDFIRTPTDHGEGIYGGHFWLNADHSAYPDVPDDLFSCNGFQGQYVFIIPSYDLVVVRMGLTEEPIFDPNNFLKEIIAAFDS
jgi:Beta-lactamase class C and other penicillin binding proteins